MSEITDDIGPEEKGRQKQVARDSTHRAVVVPASGSRPDATLRAVARARQFGYVPLVFYTDENSYVPEAAAAVGARTIESSAAESLWPTVSSVVDASEFDGALVHENVRELVAYGRVDGSLFTERQVVEAPTERQAANGEVVVGVPAFNESDSVGDVVRAARQHVDEVIVVDDGSEDDTAERAREAGAVVIEHRENRGYGAALKTVFAEAKQLDAAHLVMVDGDGQHDESDIPKLVAEQRETSAEIVVGSRFAPGSETEMPLYRRLGVAVINGLTNLSLGVVRPRSFIGDTQSGFRAYDRTAIESLAAADEVGSGMNASTDILYHGHSQGYDFREVGTTINYDVDERSTHHPVRHGFRLVSNILRTVERERPVTVLGLPGLFMIAIGVLFAYWTVSNYLSSGTFPVGLATVSGFLSITGAFSAFTGIILHSFNTHFNR